MFGIWAVLAIVNKDAYPLIPLPKTVEMVSGPEFEFNGQTTLSTDKDLYAVRDLRVWLPSYPLKSATKKGTNQVRFHRDTKLGAEAYILNINTKQIDIAYSDASGATYAVQTLKQLMWKRDGVVPPRRIEDKPRFKWRGLHLDVSRHFFGVPTIKRTLDMMKRYKLNTFHWHLVDDGGWRIQIDKYPLLTQKGAYRSGGPGKWSYSNIVFQDSPQGYGGFYTKDQIREVVKYASNMGITVVPEIELPGHALPAMAAYPELGCSNAQTIPGNTWVTNVYCPGKENTFLVLESILDEVLELFPSKYIHIGGDEVDKRWWETCPDCGRRMKLENLKDTHQLQSYFVQRIERYLNGKGRSIIGWDEILEGGLAKNAAVMSWRGIEGGISAAKMNHEVVMSPTSHSYFDYGYDSISTQHVYGWEPIPSELTPAQRRFVLGGQANVWTEWIADTRRLDRMIWPRLLATSEVLWSSAPKDWEFFEARLDSSYRILDDLGIEYYLEQPSIPTAFVFDTKPAVIRMTDFSRPVFVQSNPLTPVTEWRQLLMQELPFNKTLYFAHKRRGGSLGEIAQAYQSNAFTPVPKTLPAKGVKVDRWLGDYRKVSDFEKLPPTDTIDATGIAIESRPRPVVYALRFRSRIRFPKTNFKLFITSDDGSIVRINGVTVINHDGPHASTTKSVGIRAADGLYDLEVLYFEGGGGSSLKFEFEAPGIPRRTIAPEWLFEPLR